MRSARFVFAMAVVSLTLSASFTARQATSDRAEVALQAAFKIETIDGNLRAAIDAYGKVAATYASNRPVAARALERMGECYEKLGDAQAQKARAAYGRVVHEYGDQVETVTRARRRLAALGGSAGNVDLAARRILADASEVNGFLTADGACIRQLQSATGDVLEFQLATGQTTRITNKAPGSRKPYYVEGYAFSRNGKQIAFDRYAADGTPQMVIADLDGSNPRVIYSKSASQPFDWSPDGASILALRNVSGDAHNELVLLSAADGSVRTLREVAAAWYMLTRARFSPDGKFIAFSLVGEGHPAHGDVHVMSADGRDEVAVAAHPAEDELLDWTPDGRGLLFRSDRAGTWDIWTVAIAGGKPQGEPQLAKKDFGRYSRVLGFAPDGSLYYRTITPAGRLYVGEMDVETGKIAVPPAPVPTRYNGAPARIAWSPDGARLVYVSLGRAMGNGNNNLTIRSLDSGEERFLSTSLRRVWDVRWAPDGRALLAWGMTVTGNALVRIDAQSGEVTKVADGRWAPRMSADGKLMVYMAPDGIRIRNVETGTESGGPALGTQVVRSFSDLSPDGREIVFEADGAVMAMPLAGGTPRELFRGPGSHALTWTRDGRHIIALTLGATGLVASPSEIWRIPAQGGTPLKLDLAVPGMDSFALHPDNRHLAYSVSEGTKTEVWALENFLRKRTGT